MALEHMLATGGVKVIRKGERPEDQGELFADRLEILSNKGADGTPVISSMLADGNVTSWRYSKAESTKATPTTVAAATAASQPADPRETYSMQKLSAGKFIADLKLKPKTVATSAPAATGPADTAAIDLIASSFDVEHFVAQDAVKLDVIPPVHSPKERVSASGDFLDSHPIDGTSVITGKLNPDGTGGVRVTHGNDVMLSSRIELRNYKTDKSTTEKDKYNIVCPGPGTFHITLPPTAQHPDPTPMDISWQTKMSYDGAANLIIFEGKPLARSPGKFEDQAYLACDNVITIKLKEVEKKAKADAATAFGDFDIDWMQAVGNVDARGATYDPNGKLLSRERLSASDSLKYTKKPDGDQIDIPGTGYMVIEDNRPDKPKADGKNEFSTAGETDLMWKGSLTRNEKGTITISKDVVFLFRPEKPIKFAEGLTPASSQPARAGRGPAAPAPAPKAPSKTFILLHADQLTAVPIPPDPNAKPSDKKEKTKDDPINLGTMEIATVDVTGTPAARPTLRMGNWEPRPDNVFEGKDVYLINGNTMHVDVPRHTALIQGTTEDRVGILHLLKGDSVTGKSISIDTANGDIVIEDARLK